MLRESGEERVETPDMQWPRVMVSKQSVVEVNGRSEDAAHWEAGRIAGR